MKKKKAISAVIVLGISLVLKKILDEPYNWVFLAVGLSIFFAIFVSVFKRDICKYVALTLMSLSLALGAGELYLAWLESNKVDESSLEKSRKTVSIRRASLEEILADRPELKILNIEGISIPVDKKDSLLGFRPQQRLSKSIERFMADDNVIFDAVYTIMPSGWRLVPQHPKAEEAVIFLGCSFTFGIGLNDEDSLPFQSALMLGDKFQVYNFAFTGYGPHQMLAQIEGGLLDEIFHKYKKVAVFYVAIQHHAERAAGNFIYDQIGPWYVLKNGQAVRKGNFYNRRGFVGGLTYRLFKKSLVYQRLNTWFDALQTKDDKEELYGAIVKQSAFELKKRYGASLNMLFWPDVFYERHFQSPDLQLVSLEKVLVNHDENFNQYIFPYDGHPNRLGAKKMAETVVEIIRSAQ